MFRTIGDRGLPWESLLPAELLRLPEELARVDALLDDPAFFVGHSHIARIQGIGCLASARVT